jgi:hypothetical protein
VKAALEAQAFKAGDILLFEADGITVYCIFVEQHYRERSYGDGHCGDFYTVYKVIPFNSNYPTEYYDWEFKENLTGNK